ncbi:hypothetical protein T06_15002 [Trichinella sp. T6]|nr:hypothetical protein T06_15002 [Trichinella sp. T6]
MSYLLLLYIPYYSPYLFTLYLPVHTFQTYLYTHVYLPDSPHTYPPVVG